MVGRKFALGLLLSFVGIVPFTRGQNGYQDSLRALLPEVSGWKLVEEPEFYDRSNLFDYIDGNCELYYSFGFVGLISAMYEKEGQEGSTLIVDIYDMGTPLGAFGVYASSIYPTFHFEKIGCEAVVSELQVRFWQDRYEIELNGDVPKEAFVQFARAISRKLPACQDLPQFHWLPAEGRTPHTLKYVPEALLGHDFMPPGMEAQYQVDSVSVKAFVADAGSADSASACLAKLQNAYGNMKGAEVEALDQRLRVVLPHGGYLLVEAMGRWILGAVSIEAEAPVAAVHRRVRSHVYEKLLQGEE